MARRARRGGGSVFYSRSDGRWVANFPLGTVGGVRRNRRVKCRTEREARAELEQMRRLYGAGGHPATGTLDAWLDEWLAAHGPSVRPSTLRSYRGHCDLYIRPLLGGIELGRLAPRDVRRLIDDLARRGRSAGTIHLVIRTLSAALSAAVAERVILDHPVRGVRLPRIDREPVRALTADEADAIVAAVAGSWVERPVRVLLGSGLRRGELVGLDQGDLGDGFVRVRVTKTRARAVPVSDDAADALREAVIAAPRRGPAEPVFFAPRGTGRLAGGSLTHALARILADAGLGHLTPHALRHGAATLMLTAGVPMRVIAEQLGHANPSLTARVYAHVVPEAQRSAVAHLERRRAR